MVCTIRLKRRDRSSLSMSARTIGSGKVTRSVRPPRMAVFPNTFQNCWFVMKVWK